MRKKIGKEFKFLKFFIAIRSPLFWDYMAYFCSSILIEKKLYSHKANQFFNIQKKFQKNEDKNWNHRVKVETPSSGLVPIYAH